MKRSYSYASQQVRDAIKNGMILGSNIDEDKIQPSSFEPTLGNELYIVDSEYLGIFRISRDETVYENIYKLPQRQRQKVNIEAGFELKKGFSYLIPLQEKLVLDKETYVKSSPKSSLGRLFINSRLIADYNPSFDEINSVYCQGKEITLWLYVQPLAFNIVVHPGLTLNQLRFFSGYGAQLTPDEIINELKTSPLLYTIDCDGREVASDPVVTDGLIIHLNLSGSTTEGIIGLRARHNPNPIDLSKTGFYETEDYFEPMVKLDKVYIKRGEYYLLSSKEVLKIPAHLSVEVRDSSHVGFIGPLHFAGFIDNGFVGDLVYEIRSDELSKELELAHNMPMSKLDLYKTALPDKLYGESNNNYKYQIGPKPAKYFKKVDYKYLARKYNLLDQDVLVVDKNVVFSRLKKENGFEKLSPEIEVQIFNEINSGVYQSRYNCESDDLVLQPIIYLLIKLPGDKYFTYKKKENLDEYAETRLFGKDSIGLGSHILERDNDNIPGSVVEKAIQRTLSEREIMLQSDKKPRFCGTIFSNENVVDKYHLGLVYCIEVSDIRVGEKSVVKDWNLVSAAELKMQLASKDFESWSRILIDSLLTLSTK